MNTGRATGSEPLSGLRSWWNSRDEMLLWAHIEPLAWVEAMRCCPQDPLWHAEGDVWTHTRMVVEQALALPRVGYQRALLAIAALLHDIAKPECTETDPEGRIISPRHARIGEQMVRRLLWDIDFATREQLCALVRLHGLPLWALEKPNPNLAVIAASLRTDNSLLCDLAKADVLGRICADQGALLERCAYFEELCQEHRCWENAYVFDNDHSRFKFFFKSDKYPSVWFDDTDFEVVILSGLPGSGKDTYALQLDMPMVSLDQIRQELKIAPTDRNGQGRVANEAYERAKAFCRRKQSFVWNSTNLTAELRSKLIGTLSPYNPRFRIIYLETSLDNIFARRSEYIPMDALLTMQRILEMPAPTEAHQVVYLRH